MRSVLVIEDCIDIKDIVMNWIEETLDGRAFGATTIKDAINLLGQNKFDVIVCDFQLPDGDGDEIWAYLRQNRIQTPTILFSSHADLDTEIASPAPFFKTTSEKPPKLILKN